MSYRVLFDLDDTFEQHIKNYLLTFQECLKESEELSKTTEKPKTLQMMIPPNYSNNSVSSNQEITNIGLSNRI
jgi:hypothetical protein